MLRSLVLGNIAFNTPKEIQWNNTAVIELLLSLSFSVDELKDKIQEAGEREGAKIRVVDQMSAVLESSGFKVIPLTPETQAISFEEITDWEWEITPIKRGEQTLYLTISAILFVNEARTPRKIKSFEKEIYIKVTFIQKLGFFIKDKWDWLWGVILVPLIILIWRKWKGKKMNAEYRRRNDSDAWHWCRNCSNWPTGPGVYIIYRKPTSGELCNECRAKDSAGTCRK